VSVTSVLLSPTIDQGWRRGSTERTVRPVFGASMPVVDARLIGLMTCRRNIFDHSIRKVLVVRGAGAGSFHIFNFF
jgi:hypothetical protein